MFNPITSQIMKLGVFVSFTKFLYFFQKNTFFKQINSKYAVNYYN